MNAVLQLLRLRPMHLGHRIHFLCTSKGLISRGFHEMKMPLCIEAAQFPTVQLICRRHYGMKTPKDGKHKKGGKPKVILSDEEINNVIDIGSMREKLAMRIEKLKEDYLKHVTVRTSAGSIESLLIKYDGQEYPLNQLAPVSRKNQNLFVINLASLPQAINAVLEALQKSGMGLNPQQEGTTLYLPIPPVTREYRENLVKSAKALFVKAKEDMQDIQNQAIKSVRNKKGHFSEDLIFNVQQQIMFVTETSVTQAESVFDKKQADLLAGK